jgi:hypothetical protein|tara:strand:- start:2929 stop:3219 length:291 start_codon:yes stop_codon:yes gene_type:complete
MARRTLIDYKKNYSHEFATEDDKIVYHTKQNVQPVIEHCKHLADNKPGKDLRHVAEVPLVVYQRACREGWANDMSQWKKWLNNPDNKVFRTWNGRV